MNIDASSAEDTLKEIFSNALFGRSIFKNRDVVRPDYIPETLPFRDSQIASVAQALAPLLRSSKCSNLLLYGKTGTGKTAVAKYVLSRFSQAALSHGVAAKVCYSNTRMAKTEYRVMAEFGEQLSIDIPFTGLALSEVLDRILEKIIASKVHVVLVLDEVDFLVKSFGDDLLYQLTRVNERLSMGSLSLIGISNDLKFKEFLDPRVLSSLNEEEIVFPPYTAEELGVILRDRASRAFIEGAVTDAAINLCAALAGSEHGDARRAVDLLRIAGEVAEREGAGSIDEKHVRAAMNKIEQDRMVDALRSLPLHYKLVLIATVLSDSAKTTGEIYSVYSALSKKIGLETLTQRRISGLLADLDLLGLVSASVVSQGRYGRTKKVNPLIPVQLMKEVFSEDLAVSSLL